MKQLIKRTKIIWLLVLAVSFLGCNKDDDANLPQIVASFAHTINEDTGAVSFLNLSENADSYSWDFGDSTTSTEINPIRSFPTGTYSVVLTAKNAAGATGTFEDQIVINIPLPVNFPITFDDPNVNYDITTFNGAAFEIVDNPDLSGSNTSASKVGAITNSGAAFEGLFFDLGMSLDLTTLKSVKVNFWSDTPIDVLLKLEEGTGADAETTASHGGTGWEMITFNFVSDASYSRLTFFVDGPGTTDGTFYIDDIIQIETPAATAPTDAPPAPPARDAADVISIYGEAYGAEVGLANVDWDEGSNFAEETIASNKLLKVDFNDFLGTQLNSVVDATAMTNFHMDLWVVDEFAAGQILNPKWSNHTGGAGETNAFEYTNPIGDTDAKKWISIDIPITDFTGDNTRADLTQFLLAVASTIDVVYVDNIYFYKTGGGSGAVCTAETAESISATDFNLTFMSDQTANVIEDGGDFEWVDNPDFDNAVNSSCKVGKITKLGNNPWDNNQIDLDAKLDFNANAGLKIKVWSGRANTAVRVKLEEIGNAGNFVELEVATTTTSEWEELTFPFASADSDKFNKIVIFFDLNANNTDTYYFDDLMLYGGGGTGGTAPTNAPTAPPSRDAADVISIYGEAYGAEVGLANVDWDEGSTFAEETIAGNKLLKVDFNDFLGTQLNSVVDATTMTNFHMDLWIVDEFAAGQILNPKWSNHTGGAGETNAFEYTNPIGGTDAKKWISIDIPITDFTGDNTRADLTQFLLAVASTIDVVYVDNIYFYKTGGGGTGTTGELAVNGDFETGDISGWTTFVDTQGASFAASSTEPSTGSFSGNLIADFEAGIGAAVDAVVKQANLGAGGGVTPNTEYVVSFDLRGSAADGGVFFAEFFSELSGGGTSKAEILTGGPHPLTSTWTNYSYTVITGPDVSGGITLQMKSSCGPVANCLVDVFFDNVSIKLK